MNETIMGMLEEEYRKTLDDLSYAEAGSDEAKWGLQKLTELHKELIEEIQLNHKCDIESRKLEYDAQAETEKLKLETQETEMKKEQEKENRIMTIVKTGVDVIAIVLPIWTSWTWMARGLQFEKTGTFTSRTGSWMSSHLKLFKK